MCVCSVQAWVRTHTSACLSFWCIEKHICPLGPTKEPLRASSASSKSARAVCICESCSKRHHISPFICGYRAGRVTLFVLHLQIFMFPIGSILLKGLIFLQQKDVIAQLKQSLGVFSWAQPGGRKKSASCPGQCLWMEKLVKCDRHRQSSNNTFILQRTGGLDFLGMPHSISVGEESPSLSARYAKHYRCLLSRAGGKRENFKNPNILNKPQHFWGVNGYSNQLKYSAL